MANRKEQFSVTETAVLRMLADGLPHWKRELAENMGDPGFTVLSLAKHVSNIRKKLRLSGKDIVCEYRNRRIYYRMVVLISPRSRYE